MIGRMEQTGDALVVGSVASEVPLVEELTDAEWRLYRTEVWSYRDGAAAMKRYVTHYARRRARIVMGVSLVGALASTATAASLIAKNEGVALALSLVSAVVAWVGTSSLPKSSQRFAALAAAWSERAEFWESARRLVETNKYAGDLSLLVQQEAPLRRLAVELNLPDDRALRAQIENEVERTDRLRAHLARYSTPSTATT